VRCARRRWFHNAGDFGYVAAASGNVAILIAWARRELDETPWAFGIGIGIAAKVVDQIRVWSVCGMVSVSARQVGPAHALTIPLGDARVAAVVDAVASNTIFTDQHRLDISK